MSIKVEMVIKLPYIIKLDSPKDYTFSFEFDNFEMFNLEMRYNNKNNDDIYDKSFQVNSCNNIRIEAIYKGCDYLKYKKTRMPYTDKARNEFSVKLPPKEADKIFSAINEKFEKIINYLRNETNMFWIETIPISRIAYCLGKEIEYYFYSPNTKLNKNCRYTLKATNYYMERNFSEIKKVNDDIFEGFVEKVDHFDISKYYLNKAEKALHEDDYDDFIIYCSISVESFIKTYIGQLEPTDDIIYKKLSQNSYDYINQYYNILLKYLKGKSLNELDEAAYQHLTRMYKLRNSIMHKGIIDKDALEKSGLSHLKHINYKECEKILHNVKKSFCLIKEL